MHEKEYLNNLKITSFRIKLKNRNFIKGSNNFEITQLLGAVQEFNYDQKLHLPNFLILSPITKRSKFNFELHFGLQTFICCSLTLN